MTDYVWAGQYYKQKGQEDNPKAPKYKKQGDSYVKVSEEPKPKENTKKTAEIPSKKPEVPSKKPHPLQKFLNTHPDGPKIHKALSKVSKRQFGDLSSAEKELLKKHIGRNKKTGKYVLKDGNIVLPPEVEKVLSSGIVKQTSHDESSQEEFKTNTHRSKFKRAFSRVYNKQKNKNLGIAGEIAVISAFKHMSKKPETIPETMRYSLSNQGIYPSLPFEIKHVGNKRIVVNGVKVPPKVDVIITQKLADRTIRTIRPSIKYVGGEAPSYGTFGEEHLSSHFQKAGISDTPEVQKLLAIERKTADGDKLSKDEKQQQAAAVKKLFVGMKSPGFSFLSGLSTHLIPSGEMSNEYRATHVMIIKKNGDTALYDPEIYLAMKQAEGRGTWGIGVKWSSSSTSHKFGRQSKMAAQNSMPVLLELSDV